jgi:hypothetical protein
MSASPSMFGMDNLFRNYALNVFPITDWRRVVSPTIVLGNAKTADSDTEQQMVGSYGYQLNRILDALAVPIREHEDLKAPQIEDAGLKTRRKKEDRRMLYRLLDLAAAAGKAARQAQAK